MANPPEPREKTFVALFHGLVKLALIHPRFPPAPPAISWLTRITCTTRMSLFGASFADEKSYVIEILVHLGPHISSIFSN